MIDWLMIAYLKETEHVRVGEIVVDTVEQDVETWSTRNNKDLVFFEGLSLLPSVHKGSPPPLVVLCVKLIVSQGNCDAGC
jgi:hypothetical protein